MPALRRASAAYEVDDFQFVAFRQVRLLPFCSGDDLAIQFDRYAVLLHAEVFDELCQGCRVTGLFLAVDGDFH